MNKPKSIEEWKEIITTARESGLSDKDWCLANDVSINTFYYNVRRLRHHACEVPEPVAQNVSLQPKVVPLGISFYCCLDNHRKIHEACPALPPRKTA